LLALLRAHHILHVSRIRVNSKYHDSYTYVHYELLGICTILIADISQCSYWDTTKETDAHFIHILFFIEVALQPNAGHGLLHSSGF
jgi:hypothetical protein